ncbi:MAG TPA: hypothetical protein VFC75_00130 [Erysipelothrix sp.]|nr:hypothetical protein [Erysipelothrix sp.]
MFALVIFILILLTDILELLQKKVFRKNLDKKQFVKVCSIFAGAIFAIYILGSMFYLNRKYLLYLSVEIVVAVLLLLSYNLTYLYNKHKFEDLTQYMLRLCVYFRAHQKIQPTLLDAKEGFEGKFEKQLDEAYLAFETSGDFIASMGDISEHYLYKSLLEIFKSSEEVGHSHSEHQLTRLEYDIENLIYQTRKHQEEEAGMRNKMLLLFGMGLLISYFAQNMLAKSIDMRSVKTYQTLMFYFLSGNILCVLLLSKRLRHSWFLNKEYL